jgi:hypothetical protein
MMLMNVCFPLLCWSDGTVLDNNESAKALKQARSLLAQAEAITTTQRAVLLGNVYK